MSKQRKVIVTAAITGGIHTPSMSPYLPKGVDEVVQNAIDAANAGASMVHIHARKDITGEPTADLDIFGEILSKIKDKSEVVIGITTGGAQGMSVEERLAVIPRFKPEIASCNGGSINFCLSQLADSIQDPQFDWEVPYLKRTYDNIFKNTFKDIEYAINIMNENDTLPEFEIFDLGQISNIAYFVKKNLIKKPIYIQIVPGVMGGAPLKIDAIMFLINQAKITFGENVMYSLVAGGRRMFRYETLSAITGGNVRVGLEDGLYIEPSGKFAQSNAEQVEKICNILKKLDFEIATPDEAREILSLKGKNNVNF